MLLRQWWYVQKYSTQALQYQAISIVSLQLSEQRLQDTHQIRRITLPEVGEQYVAGPRKALGTCPPVGHDNMYLYAFSSALVSPTIFAEAHLLAQTRSPG